MIAIAAAALLAFAFRGAILRNVARYLVIDERLTASDYALIVSGDRATPQAATLVRTRIVKSVLLIEQRPRRLERLGVVPSHEGRSVAALKAAGVPEDRIEVAPGRTGGRWEAARLLGEWMDSHPDATLIAIVDAFNSRSDRAVFRSVLGKAKAVRIRYLPQRTRLHNETNWQSSRMGVRGVFTGYLAWLHAALIGEGGPPPKPWDPDEYEQALREARR